MDLRLFEGQRAHVDDPTELEIERRSTDLRRSVRLQKLLEVDLRMDHKKSLKDAAQEAVSAGRVRPECVDVAVGANSARHRKWVKSQRWRPKQIVIEQRTPVDPWSIAPDPWSVNAKQPRGLPLTVVPKDKAGTMPARPPGIWHIQQDNDAVEDQSDIIFGQILEHFSSSENASRREIKNTLPCGYCAMLLQRRRWVGDCPLCRGLRAPLDLQNVYLAQYDAEVQTAPTHVTQQDAEVQTAPTHVTQALPVPERVDIGIQSAVCAVQPRLTSGTQTTLMPIQPMMPPPPKLLQPYVCNIPRTKLRRSPDGTSVPIPAAMARSKISGNKLFLISILDRALEAQPLLWDDWSLYVRRHGCTTTDPLILPDTYLESYLSKLYGIVISPTEVF